MNIDISRAIRPSNAKVCSPGRLSNTNVLYEIGDFRMKKNRFINKDLLLFGDSFANLIVYIF